MYGEECVTDESLTLFQIQEDNLLHEFDIKIRKDQHFYENIGKYNEFFSGWSDADTNNIIVYVDGLEDFKKKRKKRFWEKLISNLDE